MDPLRTVREANADDFEDKTDGSPDHGPGPGGSQETYELVHLGEEGYLCSIPVFEPPTALNETATELAKRDEARELARASEAGWELLSALEGSCLYFMSGWWSYSFCYNREVVQFHALPMIPNGKPPVRDPNTMEFVLGRVTQPVPSQRRQQQQEQHELQQEQQQQQEQEQQQQATQDGQEEGAAGDAGGQEPVATTDIQLKGDQRYLVQRLEGGTLCDLTGRDRTIEIQYHCVPGMKADRIGWIKEVTTCAYLMVVNTPRLCNDVAFLPPKQAQANPISCRLVLDTDDPAVEAAWRWRKTLEAEAALRPPHSAIDNDNGNDDPLFAENERPKIGSGGAYGVQEPVTIGGVVVGGRKVLGQAGPDGKGGAVLKPPRQNQRQQQRDYDNLPRGGQQHLGDLAYGEGEMIASRTSKAEGGEYWSLTDEELEELDLDLDLVESMRMEIEQLAGDRGWRLDVVETPDNMRELRGYIDNDDYPPIKGEDEGGMYDELEDEGEEFGDGQDAGQDEGPDRFFVRDW